MTADDGWTFDPQLLQPIVSTIVVSWHVNHELGDSVSIRFTDPTQGQFLVAFDPEVAEYLAQLLATTNRSPGLQALADQMRAEQREGQR